MKKLSTIKSAIMLIIAVFLLGMTTQYVSANTGCSGNGYGPGNGNNYEYGTGIGFGYGYDKAWGYGQGSGQGYGYGYNECQENNIHTIDDITPEQMMIDYQAGRISVDGDNPTDTSRATFDVGYNMRTGNVSVEIPAGTQMTKTDGGNMDLTALVNQQVSIDGALGALKFGIPNLKLSFSNPITISIVVGSQYDTRVLNVYYQHDGESAWNSETTCLVSNGICAFTTTHATYFAAGSGIPGENKAVLIVKKDNNKNGIKIERRRYKFYKEIYLNKTSNIIYREVREIKKGDPALFGKWKEIFIAHRKDKKVELENMDTKTKQIYLKYKNYNGYRNYKIYRDKLGK